MDKKGERGDFTYAHFVVAKGLAHEDLRDEIFAQLCKQTTANPSRYAVSRCNVHSESNLRGWELIAFCSATFTPSPNFIKHVGAYFYQENASNSDSTIRDCAAFCMKCLRRTKMNGGRKFVPSLVEMTGLMVLHWLD